MKTRVCKGCGVEKELNTSNFPNVYRIRKSDGTMPWFQSRCKGCHSKRGSEIRSKKPRKGESALAAKRTALKYGATPAEIASILDKVFKTCEICGQGPSPKQYRLHIDHNHATGKIRGILCHWCNKAIGGIRDNSDIARRIADYLDKDNAKKI